MRRLLHVASAVLSWLVAALVLAIGLGIAWRAVLGPLLRGSVPIASEAVFGLGALAFGLALVLVCLRPNPVSLWFASFVAVLAMFVHATTWLVQRILEGQEVEAADYARMALGVAALATLGWLWRSALVRSRYRRTLESCSHGHSARPADSGA